MKKPISIGDRFKMDSKRMSYFDGHKYILGKYLRERIGTKIGKNLLFTSSQRADKYAISNRILKDKFITLSDLNAYGRTDQQL